MDFQELLEQADYNAAVNQTEGKKDGIKRYSSVLPPPKKLSKPSVQSDNIKRFLEKRKAEEAAKAAEKEREKERLLALRAQNSKNNKKAKIMASRTKDNDFSKIRMTDEEREAKKRLEEELLRKNLADKVERMKARIEMEEREKLLPKKRKRKSKNGEVPENVVDQDDLQNGHSESNYTKSIENYQPEKVHKPKPKPPPPPTMSFTDLLKIAEKRQVEPVKIVVKKKEEEKLMTKREKKLMEEEQARLKRKQERLLQQKSGLSKPSNSVQNSTINKKNGLEKEENKKPVVIHVKSEQDVKFKIPKSSVNVASNKVSLPKPKDDGSIMNSKSKSNSNSNLLGKPVKNSLVNGQKKVNKPKEDTRHPVKEEQIKKNIPVTKKSEVKNNLVQMAPKKQIPQLDEEAIKADIERKVQERLAKEREKLEKALEEKIAAKFAQFQNMQPKIPEKVPEAPKQIKKEPVFESKNTKKIVEKPQSAFYKKDMEKMIAMRKEAIEKSSLKPKLPEKTFHKNPYLDPPRRLLEPQRPPRPPMKRRIESDDEDDDDDDMSDFIDDGPSQNDEDYSKYIKEIFGYDRNRYLDDDDDDVMESTFEQQMKEEVKSARLGYLEDLEEERLEMERRKKKKLKK